MKQNHRRMQMTGLRRTIKVTWVYYFTQLKSIAGIRKIDVISKYIFLSICDSQVTVRYLQSSPSNSSFPSEHQPHPALLKLSPPFPHEVPISRCAQINTPESTNPPRNPFLGNCGELLGRPYP